MSQVKARAVMKLEELSETPFGSPDVAAMAQICEILRQLPDDDARQRVMRWSFGRFNPDFHRLGQVPAPTPAPAPAAVTPAAVTPAPVAPVAVAPIAAALVATTPAPVEHVEPADPIAGVDMSTDIATEIAAVAPDIMAPVAPRRREPTDFGRELSELEDLFPAPRSRNGSSPLPANWDVF